MEECLQRLNKLLMKYWWKPSFLSHLCHIQTNQYIRRELSGEFVSSPIMPFTSSHVSIPCRTMLFRLHCYQLSSSKFSASNMRLYLKFMYFWVADWVEWFENVCVGPVRKDWFGNNVHFVTSRYLFYERKVWIN